MRLDNAIRNRIVRYLEERVLVTEHPQDLGKSLGGDLAEYWRYRVGDYRVVCELQEQHLIVLVVAAGHRKDVYG